MICPLVTRIERNTKISLPRPYPGVCKPAVKVGQSVFESDVIGHCEVSAGQRLVKIAQLLGVRGSDISKYLTRKIGDKIYEGEIIAKKQGMFGLGKKEIKSPVDGIITEILRSGDLIVKFLPRPTRLFAGVAGVIEAIKEDMMVISTTGSKIKGFVSSGKNREGVISVVANPNDFVLPTTIKADAKGKILVGGAILEKGALEKAVTLGVHGIITGGINFKDFESLGFGREDIGVTVLVTEGFGNMPMGKDIWDFLKSQEGKAGFMLGSEDSLVISDSNQEKTVEKKDGFWRQVAVGDKVRFFREESPDQLGVVTQLPGKQIINSGILTEVALIKTSGGEELVPAANLELTE